MAYDPNGTTENRLGPWGWFAVVVLFALLAAAAVYSVYAWSAVDATMSPMGWFFLILGVVVTVVVGAGLMWLLFYSSRNNYDR